MSPAVALVLLGISLPQWDLGVRDFRALGFKPIYSDLSYADLMRKKEHSPEFGDITVDLGMRGERAQVMMLGTKRRPEEISAALKAVHECSERGGEYLCKAKKSMSAFRGRVCGAGVIFVRPDDDAAWAESQTLCDLQWSVYRAQGKRPDAGGTL